MVEVACELSCSHVIHWHTISAVDMSELNMLISQTNVISWLWSSGTWCTL